MSNSAAPPIPSTIAATPNPSQPFPCEEDATSPTIAAPTDHGITCLLNFDLDHRWDPGTDGDGDPFWFGWIITPERMNEDQEPDDTLAYDDEDTSGASEIGKNALIEKLKTAARRLGFTHFEVRNYSPEPSEYEILGQGALYPAEPFSEASGAHALRRPQIIK
jgi:hypothetical protein